MERILLVEPNYGSKYPPIGLMKIATYYENKGDFVEFYKGKLASNRVKIFDKIFITTMFTYHFDICIKTIKHYVAIAGIEKVLVGGIAATIMPDKFLEKIPELNLLTKQLTSSNILGYADDINIDILELNYDILWDIAYEYPAADSYFVYTTRGCPRKCSFCAVKTLEPKFYECNNICEQIECVDKRYGIKKNLLIMDNNILYSDRFESTINHIIEVGFGQENNKSKKNSKMKYYIQSIEERIKRGKQYEAVIDRIKKEFLSLTFSRINRQDKEYYEPFIYLAQEGNSKQLMDMILREKVTLSEAFERYHFHTISRFVDFNQGLDARLFTEEKAKNLSKLALKPCRIAFDNLQDKDVYLKAMKMAVTYGIRNFSNYLLYNYEDKPEDLWERLRLNVEFAQMYRELKISLFSFPMKYSSVEYTDRSYIGQHWNKKYLRGLNVILNVTSGIVAKEKDFFLRAYGRDINEFILILTMPDNFIRYRDYFEKNGRILNWKTEYNALSQEEKQQLIHIVERIVEEPNIILKHYTERLDKVLAYYSINKESE